MVSESKPSECDCEELPRNEMETSQSKQPAAEPTLRRSQRVAGKPDQYGGWINFVVTEPTTVSKALSCAEKTGKMQRML